MPIMGIGEFTNKSHVFIIKRKIGRRRKNILSIEIAISIVKIGGTKS